MKLYHALKPNKLEEIQRAGKITSPVRCYKTIDQATTWANKLGLSMIIEIEYTEFYTARYLNSIETLYIEEDINDFKIVKVISNNLKE